LVATAEAMITLDFFRRVRGRLKDPLSRSFKDWHDQLPAPKQLRPPFNEGGILDLLKDAGGVDSHIVGRFRECLDGRHWLAHGRRENRPIAIDQFSPDDVIDRANALLLAIP
jgi:hypothetical protein